MSNLSPRNQSGKENFMWTCFPFELFEVILSINFLFISFICSFLLIYFLFIIFYPIFILRSINYSTEIHINYCSNKFFNILCFLLYYFILVFLFSFAFFSFIFFFLLSFLFVLLFFVN